MAAPRRDSAHRGYDTAYLLSPVAPSVVAALPDALQRLVADDFMGMVSRMGGSRAVAHSTGALVQPLPPELTDIELLQRVREAGYRGAPIAIGTAGDRVAVLVPHLLADGTESIALLQALLTVAAGAAAPDVPAPVRFPVLRAIRATGLAPFRMFAAERSRRPAVEASAAVRTAPALASLTLTPERLVEVKRGRSSGGRATISTRLASIALTALLATARDDRVAELVVPIDLRFAAGGRVAGNFVHGVVLGAVGDDWAPGTLSAALAEQRRTVIPAMVSGLLRPRRAAAKQHTSWSQRLAVTVPMMQVPDLPAEVWAPSTAADRRFLTCSLSENADLMVVIATWKDAATVTLLDATGWIDVDRFPDAFLAEIDARLVRTA